MNKVKEEKNKHKKNELKPKFSQWNSVWVDLLRTFCLCVFFFYFFLHFKFCFYTLYMLCSLLFSVFLSKTQIEIALRSCKQKSCKNIICVQMCTPILNPLDVVTDRDTVTVTILCTTAILYIFCFALCVHCIYCIFSRLLVSVYSFAFGAI